MNGQVNPSTGLDRRPCELVRRAFVRVRSHRPVECEAEPLATERPRAPLEFRIDGHMRMVRRGLDQIRELNPSGTPRDDLPEEVWDSLAWRGERALIDLVDSEVRFWAALIANNPTVQLGEREAAWVGRVTRLASIIRESEDRRRRDLDFLRDRFLREVPGLQLWSNS